MRMEFHNVWCNKIKNDLNLSFCGYEKLGGKLSLKTAKGKKVEYIDFNVSLDRINTQVYEQVLEQLRTVFI